MVIICWGIVVITLILSVICFLVMRKKQIKGKEFLFAMISIVAIAIIFGAMFTLYGTEAGKRSLKDISSNYSGGIARSVEVYDTVGNLKKQYVGKFDIDANDIRILFDDENGLRHIIYQGTGQIIIDELE